MKASTDSKVQTKVQHRAQELAPIEKALTAVKVKDAASYQQADAMLSEAAREHAELVALRKEATGPAYKSIRTIEGWFRPALQSLDRCIAHLKGELGAYRVQLEAAERDERAKALEAAQSGEHGSMTAALQAASVAGVRPPGRSSATFEWRVATADPAKMPREYLAVDWSKLKIVAKNAGDEPPSIPGVTFERHARIGAKK